MQKMRMLFYEAAKRAAALMIGICLFAYTGGGSHLGYMLHC